MSLTNNVYLSKCGESEKTQVVFNDLLSDGEYWLISSTTVDYYIWYGTTDPAVAGKTGIQVVLGISADTTAANTVTALNNSEIFISYKSTTATIQVWCKKPGPGNAAAGSGTANVTVTEPNTGVAVDPSNGPEQGELGIDYVYFISGKLQAPMKSKNLKRHLVGRTSFRVPLGKIQYGAALQKCAVLEVGDPDTPNELSLTNIIRFLNDANTISGSYILYLFIYSPMLGGKYHPFIDNNNVPQIYMRCTVDGAKWKFSAKDLFYSGNITLDECWIGN